ncbi:MAG: hypothetical protein WKF94_15205 [Solirubrobacteraceae bacterium]
MSKAWTTWLRRLNVALIALLLPTGAVGFSALIAGPKNTAIVSVFPPRYSVTNFPATETHAAWAALLVSLAWLLLLTRAKGPWGDSGRCALLLALATGSGLAPEPVWFASFYLIVAGGSVALVRAVRSLRGVVVFVLTCAWLFAGLVGWLFTAPPGWLVLLVIPACAPIGAWLERWTRDVRSRSRVVEA